MTTSPRPAARARRRWIYPAVATFITAMVLWGFSATYFSPLVAGGLDRPWIVHVHAVVFTGWLALFLAQTALAASGRVRWHRRLGVLGVVHGVLVFVTGIAVTIGTASIYVGAGVWEFEPTAAFLLLPLGDMALFAGFFGAGIAARRRPDVHRRLMLAATVAAAYPGFARLGLSEPVLLVVWLAPMLAVMLDERLTEGRAHRVTFASTAILAVAFTRLILMDTEIWMPIGRALLSAML